MKCKHCQAELTPGESVCPVCGKQTAPNNSVKIIIASVLCVLLVVALVFVVLLGSGMQISFGGQETTVPVTDPTNDPSSETTLPEDLVSYSATDNAQAAAAADNIVATAGTKKLTNAELQSYYWMCVYQFYNENYYYLSYYGLDISKPLDQQIYDTTNNTTWQQAFLTYAVETWHRYAALLMLAEENGYELSDEEKAYVDNLPQRIRDMALEYGYDSVEKMLLTEMGPGATVQGHAGYMANSYLSTGYVESIYDTLQPTMEQIEAFYEENEGLFAQYGISKEDGDVVDVRHILLFPKGGTTDEQGNVTYSDADYEACKVEAQKLLDQWKAGEATQESFAALANLYSEDGGSNTNGGLYTDVAPGDMLETFDAWIFDESRKPGDTGLVRTVHGYHIMYFVDREEAWIRGAEAELVYASLEKLIADAQEKWPVTMNFDQVVIGQANMNAQ